jgi:hypothetical protein
MARVRFSAGLSNAQPTLYLKFEVLIAVTRKTVFRNVMICSLAEVPFAPEDVGSMLLQNIGELLQITCQYIPEDSDLCPLTRLFFSGCKLDDAQT